MEKLTKTPNGKELYGFIDDVVEEINNKSDKNHTHLYAGSDSVGGPADSARKLTVSAGDVNHPVYFDENGEPQACGAIGIVMRSWT